MKFLICYFSMVSSLVFAQEPMKYVVYLSTPDFEGPIVGLLFDFAIRHETQNKKSLADVTSKLYKDFYKSQKRGFTENELRETINKVAGRPLDGLFTYIYTTARAGLKKVFRLCWVGY